MLSIKTFLWRSLLFSLLIGVPLAWAADVKISALPAASVANLADEFPANQAGTTRKVTGTQLQTLLGIDKVALTADFTTSSTTGTEVTGLSRTLAAGTYVFQYFLVVQSTAVGTGIKLGVNFTGTQTRISMTHYYLDTGTTASVGNIDDQPATGTEQLIAGGGQRVVSTTAPNLDSIQGFAAANVDNFTMVSGVIIVTVAGDLELWASSETGGTTVGVETGSSLIITRTN